MQQEKRQYKSKMFQQMYDQFRQMFAQEGDCYDSILESLNKDYDHNMIDSAPPKHLIKGVLQDVTVDFYKHKIKVLTEKEYLNEHNEHSKV